MDLIVTPAEEGTDADRPAWSLPGASIAFAAFVRSRRAISAWSE